MGKSETEKMGASGARSTRLWLLTIVLCAVVLYLPSLKGDFCLDDYPLIIDSPVAHGINLAKAFSNHFLQGFVGADNLYYRPLITASYQTDYSLSGEDPFAFRLTNLLMYLATGVVLFFLIRKLTGNTAIAGITGIAFAVMPSHTESVSWISGRTDIIVTLFMLGSLMLFIKQYENRDRFNWPLAILCSLLFLLALLSKESALMLPVLFGLYVWIYGQGIKRDELAKWALVLLPSLVLYIVVRRMVLGGTLQVDLSYFMKERILRVGSIYAGYLRMLFIPHDPQVIYEQFRLKLVKFTPLTIGAWIAPIGIIALAIKTRRSLPHIAFGLGWIFINLFPVSDMLPTKAPLMPMERFSYLASIGSSFVIGWLVWKLYTMRPGKIAVWPVAVGIIAAAYGMSAAVYTVSGSQIYQSNLSWSRRVAAANPHWWVFRASAAQFFSQAGETEAAVREYEAVLKYGLLTKAEKATTSYKLGVAYAGLGYGTEAARCLTNAVKGDPKQGDAWKMLGLVRVLQGRPNEAVTAYKKAAGLVNLNARDYLLFGRAYKELGNKEKAEDQFRAAITADPTSKAGRDAAAELKGLSTAP